MYSVMSVFFKGQQLLCIQEIGRETTAANLKTLPNFLESQQLQPQRETAAATSKTLM